MKFEISIMDILTQLYLLKKKKQQHNNNKNSYIPDLDRHLSLQILTLQLLLFIEIRSRKPVTE